MTVGDEALTAAQRPTSRARVCEHLDQIRDVVPDSRDGCPECLALGDTWVHLRMCMSCGHVGCCDSSKNRHASRHAAASGHPIMRSIEEGESWFWCTVDRMIVEPPVR